MSPDAPRQLSRSEKLLRERMRATGLGITYYKYLESIDSLLVNTGSGCGLLPCSEVDGQVRNVIVHVHMCTYIQYMCVHVYSTCCTYIQYKCVHVYTVHVCTCLQYMLYIYTVQVCTCIYSTCVYMFTVHVVHIYSTSVYMYMCINN